MNLEKLTILQLVELRTKMILEGNRNLSEINIIIGEKESDQSIMLLEEDDASGSNCFSGGVAYSDASSVGGMGPVVSSQPSSYAGSTINPDFAAGGGLVGSGDVSFPYNPGGGKRMFQKASSNNLNKGVSKRRKNKAIAGLKSVFAKKQDFTAGQGKRTSKIMSWDSFQKDNITKVTKVKESMDSFVSFLVFSGVYQLYLIFKSIYLNNKWGKVNADISNLLKELKSIYKNKQNSVKVTNEGDCVILSIIPTSISVGVFSGNMEFNLKLDKSNKKVLLRREEQGPFAQMKITNNNIEVTEDNFNKLVEVVEMFS